MWIFNYDSVWNDDDKYDIFFDRCFRVDKIVKKHIYGGNSREIGRYEIWELWTSLEQPKMWDRDYLIRNDKKQLVAWFTEKEAVNSFLRLLAYVLNAPPEIPMSRIISPELLDMISTMNIEEIYKVKEKERKNNIKYFTKGTVVYVFEVENTTVKIGFTNDVVRRAAAVTGHSGLKITRICFTVPLANAPDIEKRCHLHFAKQRRYNTEFFDISFEEAQDYLASLAKLA